MRRIHYYQRIAAAYLTHRTSQLTFWHENPEVNENVLPGRLGEYYMPFISKAAYEGQHDTYGIPLLDYQGAIGLQYNPIAIAQYGLGNYNVYKRSGDSDGRKNFLRAADWLTANLKPNSAGVMVWSHWFDWEYRSPLIAPWYSGLAQGQGISLLLRAHLETGVASYFQAAHAAFQAFSETVEKGGVIHVSGSGNTWIEEYIVWPPTHILNGCIWASWGVYDFALATGSDVAWQLWKQVSASVIRSLPTYDTGFWSLYEHSGTRLRMLASPFYHRLHVVQLKVMGRLTGSMAFDKYACKWDKYAHQRVNKSRAVVQKCFFKALFY